MDQEEKKKEDEWTHRKSLLASHRYAHWFRLFHMEFESVESIVALDYDSKSFVSAAEFQKKLTPAKLKVGFSSIFDEVLQR